MHDQNSRATLKAELTEAIPALRAFARRFTRDPAEIDDLVQDALMRGLDNLDKFQPGTRMKSWLFTILRNRFCTSYVRAKREPVGLEECVADKRSVAASQEWSLQMSEMERALHHLPDAQREALQAIVFEGLSYEDVAFRQNCRLGTVKSRVNRARIALAEELDPH